MSTRESLIWDDLDLCIRQQELELALLQAPRVRRSQEQLTVELMHKSHLYNVIDFNVPGFSGMFVIRAAYCTKDDAELFAAAPRLLAENARLRQERDRLKRLRVVRAWTWVENLYGAMARKIARRV